MTRSSKNGQGAGWNEVLDLAKYEIDVDPYRGMIDDSGPWKNQCSWGLSDEGSSSMVYRATKSNCPCLDVWSQEAMELKRREEKKRSKNKQKQDFSRNLLGKRSEDETFVCICDYNPYCLGTLGGAMNVVLENLSARLATSIKQSPVIEIGDDTTGDEDVSTAEVSVVELSNKRNDTTMTETSDLSVSDVLEKLQNDPKDNSVMEDSALSEDSPIKDLIVSKPITCDPAIVYTDQASQHFDLIPLGSDAYSKTTTEQLTALRKSFTISPDLVRDYAKRYIEDEILLQDYMTNLAQRQKQLLFTKQTKSLVSDKLTLSIPPGIHNLGATCYLNTQLQCLAQNLAFLKGIFSWKENTTDSCQSRMNSVLSTMQLLLARMVHGGECTVTTKDFSSALGLENDEMQDPNEFARLLFDRLHDAFQHQFSLSQLLPQLFAGTMCNVTTCLTCETKSSRSEGFMDLNLPILNKKPQHATTVMGTLDIKNALGRQNDTTLQECLDGYASCAELLEGENQYWCTVCQCKQDAKRVVTFSKLPPVLNIQLSRYIYDRKKGAKKKLTDRVLLPKVLKVTDTPYLLCAVMKHQGNSAYRGHYVAEAMDWQTGTWYNFDDDKVTVLWDGPSCSYNPDERKETGGDTEPPKKKKRKAQVQGSSDAYNLYYVDLPFLSRHINETSNVDTTDQSVANVKVSEERNVRYNVLKEMCCNDEKTSDRLARRRVGIVQSMLQLSPSLEFGCKLQEQTTLLKEDDSVLPGMDASDSAPVWVHGSVLRQFLSCKDNLDGMLRGDEDPEAPLLRHKQYLCQHKVGLHPRVARQGKLLPRSVYNAFVSLLRGERQLLQDDTAICPPVVNDLEITPQSHMYCEACANSYRDEILEKLEVLYCIGELYHDLDPKNDVSPEKGVDSQELYYIVSRRFCTSLRSQIAKIIKRTESFGGSVSLAADRKRSGDANGRFIGEGIDALDLSLFLDSNAVDCGLDRYVNQAITCEHGNCSMASNKQKVRYVSQDVWSRIKKLFPHAIEHSRNYSNEPIIGCPTCQQSIDELTRVHETLQDWAKRTVTANDGALQKYQNKKPVSVSPKLISDLKKLFPTDDDSVKAFMVHREDVDRLHAALSFLKGASKKDEQVLSTFCERVWPGLDAAFAKSRRWEMRSLVCRAHSKSLASCLAVNQSQFIGSAKPPFLQLEKHVVMLSEAEYQAFTASVSDLEKTLSDLSAASVEPDLASEDNGSPTKDASKMTRTPLNQLHPELQFSFACVPETDCSSKRVPMLVSNDSYGFKCLPEFCDCTTHRAIVFEDWKQAQQSYGTHGSSADTALDIVDVDAEDPQKASSKSEAASTAKVSNETDQLLDERKPGELSLRVFEIEVGTSFDKGLSKVLSFVRDQANAHRALSQDQVRRSSRKRKTVFPDGISGEDDVTARLEHNVAALRLLLYQSCRDFPIDQEVAILLQSEWDEGTANRDSSVVGLPFEWGSKTLKEIFVNAGVLNDDGKEDEFSSKQLLLVRYSLDGSRKTKKREAMEAFAQNESLMDSLIETSNLALNEVSLSDDKGEKGNANGSRKRKERGFVGTFLHSGSREDTMENQEATDEPETSSSISNTTTQGEKADSKHDSSVKQHPEVDIDHAKRPEICILDETDDETSHPEVLPPSELEVQLESAHGTPMNGGAEKRFDISSVSDAKAAGDEASKLSAEESTSTTESGKPSRRSVRDEDIILHSLRKAVADNCIKSTPSVDFRCREAARWARQNTQNGSLESLTDVALAKFFEDS